MSTIESTAPIAPVAFVPPATNPSSPAVPELHRFSVDEYHRMMEIGVLKEEDRVELLEGVVRKMMTPIGTHHGVSVELTRKAVERLTPAIFSVWSQQAITTSDSEPQPDVYVARGEYRSYAKHHPGPADLVLVVEVADTSLVFDRTEKQRIYAAAGIAEYWIVNLPERKLELYRKPIAASGEQPARYETVTALTADQSFEVVLDGTAVGGFTVGEILP